MHGIYFTHKKNKNELLNGVLKGEGFELIFVSELSALERAYRQNFPRFVLLDAEIVDKKISFERWVEVIYNCIGICLNASPLYKYDGTAFYPCYISELHKNAFNNNSDIIKLLERVSLKIKSHKNLHEELFRPSERKVYKLLKNTEQESISLDHMSESLWGYSSVSHKKTLYSYIYRIKQILNSNRELEECLIKDKKGYYKISILNNSY